MTYGFPTTGYRAQCVKVVDGDTFDLYIDQGFHTYRRERVRLYGIDAYELRSKDEAERALAAEAKQVAISLLHPEIPLYADWPLRIVTQKDPDSFGRYLALVYYKDALTGAETDFGQVLIGMQLAVPWLQ